MYINYEDYTGVMEDFSDVLMDFDIACEGLVDTAKNIVTKAIEFLIKVFRQLEQFVKSKLKKLKIHKLNKEKKKRMYEKPGEETQKPKKKIYIKEWKMGQVPQLAEQFLNKFKFNVISDLIPEYRMCIEEGGVDRVKACNEKIKEKGQMFEYLLDTVKCSDFWGKSVNVQLTEENVSKFDGFDTVADKLLEIVLDRQHKIIDNLNKLRNQVERLNNLKPDVRNKDFGEITKMMSEMRSVMVHVTSDTKHEVDSFESLVNEFSKDYNKYKLFLKGYDEDDVY